MKRASSVTLLLVATMAATSANEACKSDDPATGGNSPGMPGTSIPLTDGGSKVDSGKVNVVDAGQDSGSVDAGPPLCDPTISWTSNGRLPALDTTSLSELGAVSGTELTLAWTKANGDLYVADRADTSSNFSTANKVDTGTTALATGRVALSPTGKAIIAVASGGTSLVELDRATTTSTTWTKASENVFAQINAFLAEASGKVSEPVIGADKLTLYFLATLGANPPFIYESRYAASVSQWASPGSLLPTALRSTNATNQRRRPTGASADRRTLFFYDEVGGLERAAWRTTPDTAFSQFVDLTGFSESVPNTACDTLYFQASDTGGAGVFTAQ